MQKNESENLRQDILKIAEAYLVVSNVDLNEVTLTVEQFRGIMAYADSFKAHFEREEYAAALEAIKTFRSSVIMFCQDFNGTVLTLQTGGAKWQEG